MPHSSWPWGPEVVFAWLSFHPCSSPGFSLGCGTCRISAFSELAREALSTGLWTVSIFSAASCFTRRTSQAFLLRQLHRRLGCWAQLRQQSQSSCCCEVKGAVPRHHRAASTTLSRCTQGLTIAESSSTRSLREDPCDPGALSRRPAPPEEPRFSPWLSFSVQTRTALLK